MSEDTAPTCGDTHQVRPRFTVRCNKEVGHEDFHAHYGPNDTFAWNLFRGRTDG